MSDAKTRNVCISGIQSTLVKIQTFVNLYYYFWSHVCVSRPQPLRRMRFIVGLFIWRYTNILFYFLLYRKVLKVTKLEFKRGPTQYTAGSFSAALITYNRNIARPTSVEQSHGQQTEHT